MSQARVQVRVIYELSEKVYIFREEWPCGHSRVTKKDVNPLSEVKVPSRKCPTCVRKLGKNYIKNLMDKPIELGIKPTKTRRMSYAEEDRR